MVVPHAGAWIEIKSIALVNPPTMSRPTRARGLKFRRDHQHATDGGRAPRGRVD